MTHYIKKIVVSLFALAGAVLVFSPSASAADFTDLCSDLTSGVGTAGLPCTVEAPEFNSGGSGNDKEVSVEAALAYVYGEIIDVTEVAKIENGGNFALGNYGDFTITSIQSGPEYTSINWSFSGEDGPEYASVKSSTGYALFYIGGLTSGSLFTDALITSNDNAKAISHITFWDAGNTQQVSTPEIASLMLLGLASVVVGTRRRRKA